MTEAVLFDLDGVLLDSATAIIGCINEALVSLGEPARPPAALRRFVGPPLADGFAELIGPERAGELVTAYRTRYATASLERTTVFPGMLAVLEDFGARVPLAVATSKPLAYSKPLCDHLGLTPYFAAIEGPGLAETEPKTVTVRRALDALGLQPGARAPLIGDRLHDVEAAHANGLRCVACCGGSGTSRSCARRAPDPIVPGPPSCPAAVGRSPVGLALLLRAHRRRRRGAQREAGRDRARRQSAERPRRRRAGRRRAAAGTTSGMPADAVGHAADRAARRSPRRRRARRARSARARARSCAWSGPAVPPSRRIVASSPRRSRWPSRRC